MQIFSFLSKALSDSFSLAMSHFVCATNNPVNDNRQNVNTLRLHKNLYPFSPSVIHLLSVHFRFVGQR